MDSEGHRLDPEDWGEFARQMHALLDACLERMETARDLPWRPVPEGFAGKVALDGDAHGAQTAFAALVDDIMPKATGNTHPRFWGWVHGTGLPVAVGAEMAAATMNANVGGRWQGATEVERAVLHQLTGIAGMDATASGILTGGTSQATLLALQTARLRAFGTGLRQSGIAGLPPVSVYVAEGGHSCIAKALEILGHGAQSLRHIPLDGGFRMDVGALSSAIAEDRRAGRTPLAIVGTAGSVGIGAFDDLSALADLAAAENIWLHVDSAFGFWLRLADPPLRDRVDGIGRADSIALDLHKWIGVPYDCGACLIADADLHREAFTTRPDYLAQGADGLAGGDHWFCDYGLDLSRGFRALKVWTAFKSLGLAAFGAAIRDNCRQAALMGQLVDAAPDLELAAPVLSNICCFRVPGKDPGDLAARLQIAGQAVFSTTRVDGEPCLRAAIVNHRTTTADIHAAIDAVRAIAAQP
ncbi:MAG: pyridoxal phosphate-dependent decarboxylase family protein [Marinibacterium sp.]